MSVTAIVPAGGTVGGRYSEATGTSIRCLAPLGPGKQPVLNYVVKALKNAPDVKKIVVAAPEEARHAVENVDWCLSGNSGPESIYNALRLLEDSDKILICASDLPFLTSEAISDFISRSDPEKDLTLGLVRAGNYDAAFPGSPPSKYVALRETGPVTIGCLFLFTSSALQSSRPILDACFASRKSLLRTAALMGPAVILRLITGTLKLQDLVMRGTKKTGLSFDILTDVSPHLAFDIDTVEDYEYADTHIG